MLSKSDIVERLQASRDVCNKPRRIINTTCARCKFPYETEFKGTLFVYVCDFCTGIEKVPHSRTINTTCAKCHLPYSAAFKGNNFVYVCEYCS